MSTAEEQFAPSQFTKKKEWVNQAARASLALVTLAILAPLFALIGYLIYRAWPVLSLEFILDVPRNDMREGGIWPAFIGTIYLVATAVICAAPLGVLAAIYLNEYARDNWLTRAINLAVINLAGVPSIVYALFGLGAFVYTLGLGYSILAASLTLGVMTLPVIITSTREALAAVPMAFREACWNLGATRWQTIRAVVLPNSIGGILTGVILEVCRAAGETAPIMFTGAVFYKYVERGDLFPYGLLDQCMALSLHVFTLSTQVPNVDPAVQYGTAVVLLGLVLTMNAVAIVVRYRVRRRRRW